MSKYDIYADIAERTNGDLYVGVVGPVRCGKSTFISSFMQQFVFPNIKEVNVLNRAKDELPQSGDGKLVMTTQPKFVPNEAVSISVADNVKCNIRMIDCVGFMVDGAVSGEEGKARMVKTPWSEEEIPFEEASEIGTKKVITEHSNIAIMLTTDGSFTSIDRANYIKAEKQTVKELKSSHKPFVIALNSHSPNSKECKEIAEQISKEYDAPVVRINAKELSEENVTEIFVKVLSEFNIKSIKINMPNWLRALDANDNLILEIKEEGNNVIIDINGNGFRRYMVRMIVGTLIAIGTNKLDISKLDHFLDINVNDRVSYKAPSQGLYLLDIDYGGKEND